MTGTAIAPPAGWYSDPADASAQRWWDGVGWTTYVRPVTEPPVAVEPSAPSPPQPDHDSSQPQFGSLEWRDRAAAEMSSVGTYGSTVTTDQGLPNHEATRALISGGLLVGILIVDLILQLPVYVRITGIVVAIVLGLLGLRRWRTTGTGLKRSVAGLSIGALMGLLAIIGVVVLPGFQQAGAYSTHIEQAIIDTSNSLQMSALAVDAVCPTYTAVPPVGTVMGCILDLDDGSRYDVTVTVSSADGSSTIVIQPLAG